MPKLVTWSTFLVAVVRTLQAADQECGTACHLLGQMAEQGLGYMVADHEEAVAWFGRGAARGHAACAHALAFALENGLGEMLRRIFMSMQL